MSFRSIRWKKWLTVAVVLGMVAVGPVGYFGYHHGSSALQWMEKKNRWSQYRKSQGILRDLAEGNIKAGNTVESLLAIHPELKHYQIERWTFLCDGPWPSHYHPQILAQDGKLVSAAIGGNGFKDFFFEWHPSPTDELEYNRAMKRESDRMIRENCDRNILYVALAGVAANVEFYSGNGDFSFPKLDYPPDE
jgi:hypothetical protein